LEFEKSCPQPERLQSFIIDYFYISLIQKLRAEFFAKMLKFAVLKKRQCDYLKEVNYIAFSLAHVPYAIKVKCI